MTSTISPSTFQRKWTIHERYVSYNKPITAVKEMEMGLEEIRKETEMIMEKMKLNEIRAKKEAIKMKERKEKEAKEAMALIYRKIEQDLDIAERKRAASILKERAQQAQRRRLAKNRNQSLYIEGGVNCWRF